MGFFVTHLVLEERVPDILRHSRHTNNVTLALLVSLATNTIVERDTVNPDQPESAGRESAQSWVGVGPKHPLEQLCPSRVLSLTPERIVAVLL